MVRALLDCPLFWTYRRIGIQPTPIQELSNQGSYYQVVDGNQNHCIIKSAADINLIASSNFKNWSLDQKCGIYITFTSKMDQRSCWCNQRSQMLKYLKALQLKKIDPVAAQTDFCKKNSWNIKYLWRADCSIREVFLLLNSWNFLILWKKNIVEINCYSIVLYLQFCWLWIKVSKISQYYL